MPCSNIRHIGAFPTPLSLNGTAITNDDPVNVLTTFQVIGRDQSRISRARTKLLRCRQLIMIKMILCNELADKCNDSLRSDQEEGPRLLT